MEHTIDGRFEPSSSIAAEEKVELLEECWFFGNLLDKRAKTMSRCYSDLSSSSNMSVIGRSTSQKQISGGFDRPSLSRAPSLPCSMGKVEERGKEEMIKPTRQSLARAPSLPPCIGREEDVEESEFALSRLIRQASLNSPEVLPPRHASKAASKQSSSAPRQHHLLKKPERESPNMMRHQIIENTTITRKNPSNGESDKVRGFKELGSESEKKDLNPRSSVAIAVAGAQEKSKVGMGSDEGDKARRPNLPQAWLVRTSSAPPIPKLVEKSSASSSSSSAEDMKAHIKFWARAVAANVR